MKETRKPLPGVVISLPGTESTGFSRAGDLVRRVMTALADRDRRKDNDLENRLERT